MESLNKSVAAPLQNDSVFFDGSFLFRRGLTSTDPFREKCGSRLSVKDRVVRIMRITGPLLPLASGILFSCQSFLEKRLIPFGIALMWYTPSSSPIPYAAEPEDAVNLLPCTLDVRAGTNGFYLLHFKCSKDILITVPFSSQNE